MPKNLFQDIVFSILMIIVMVFSMSCYNIAIQFGGLSYSHFLMALECLWYMGLIALAVELLIVGPIVRKLSARVLGKDKVHPVLAMVVHSALTVCFMCFIMTFFATLIEKRPTASQFFVTWIQTMILSFPMALCWQIFVAGPFVRLIFRCIFVYPQRAKERKKMQNNALAIVAQDSEAQNIVLEEENTESKVVETADVTNKQTKTKASSSSKTTKTTRSRKKS